MTCRQPINQYQLHPRHKLPRDTHLELAELLRDNLVNWLKGVHPMTTKGTRKIYAEEIIDQAFDAIHDLAMDIDATPEDFDHG